MQPDVQPVLRTLFETMKQEMKAELDLLRREMKRDIEALKEVSAPQSCILLCGLNISFGVEEMISLDVSSWSSPCSNPLQQLLRRHII